MLANDIVGLAAHLHEVLEVLAVLSSHYRHVLSCEDKWRSLSVQQYIRREKEKRGRRKRGKEEEERTNQEEMRVKIDYVASDITF